MKNQILNMGAILSRAQQKQVFGGTLEDGKCRDAGIGNLPKGCACNADHQCKSKKCSGTASGSQWFHKCVDNTLFTNV